MKSDAILAFRPRSAVCLLLAGLAAAPSPARAEEPAAEQAFNLSLPAGPLAAALNRLAETSGVHLVYDAALTQGLQSPAVSGSYTVEQALQKLLQGSGLIYRFNGNRTVTLEKPATVRPDEGAALGKVTVTAKVGDDPTSYKVSNASTATRTDTPIMETPLNIQVVPHQVLNDEQAVRVEKALENVSGVNFISQGVGGASFNIRGFDTLSYYRDGVRVDTQILNNVFPDVAPLEQIEVLKGPASILYGRLDPGGLVNLVSKQPLASPYYALQQQFGSYDFYRTTLDATGPVAQSDSVLYRVNLAYENAGSFDQLAQNNRFLLAPVLRWNISEQTQADFYLQYMYSKDAPAGTLPAVGNRPADVPLGRNLGERSSKTNTDDIRVGFNWSHAFNDRWALRHSFNANLINNPFSTVGIQGLADPVHCTGQSCPVARTYFNTPIMESQAYYTSLNLTGKIDTWRVAHTLLMGWDYLKEDSLQSGVLNFSTIPTIDLYSPWRTGTGGLAGNPDYAYSWSFAESWNGLYFQDQMKLPFDFHLLAGFRYDIAERSNRYTYTVPPLGVVSDAEKADALKPRVGLVWQPLPEFSVYGNYVENFGLTNGHSADGTLLPPTTAQQKEIGIKTEQFDQRLMATLAWFDLTKQNIATPASNLALAAAGVESTTGAVRNQGLELDISGEIRPGLRMIGSYAYINSQIIHDVGVVYDNSGNPISTNHGNQGHRYFGVPRHGGSLWLTYEPQEGSWKGLKLGAGAVARSQRQGDNENSYQLPGYAVVNLMAGYSMNVGASKVTAQVNINNLLDKTYFNPFSGSGRNFVFAAPRTVLGSIRVEF